MSQAVFVFPAAFTCNISKTNLQGHGSHLDELIALQQLSKATAMFIGGSSGAPAALKKVLEQLQNLPEASSARHLEAEAAFLAAEVASVRP